MKWEPHAERLAAAVAHPASRWRRAVASVPRHLFVPCWWERAGGRDWQAADGPSGEDAWAQAAYSDRTIVTRVGAEHADHAGPGGTAHGRPTSSSTHPGLVVSMYRHGMIGSGMDVLDVGTGSGYGTALLAVRFGAGHVTSVDVDPYVVEAAGKRLAEAGLNPVLAAVDATGPLPGAWDRIVSMTSVAPVPAGWLAALRPGGRLVTVISGTALIVTADKTPDGGAQGRTEWNRAWFMETRRGPDYPPDPLEMNPAVRAGEGDGAETGTGRYPVVDTSAFDVYSMVGVLAPGTEHYHEKTADGQRASWLIHPDGSWAMAAAHGSELPVVRQGGPRRLWDLVDGIRDTWVADGGLPVYGANVTISPDGGIRFSSGTWAAEIPAG